MSARRSVLLPLVLSAGLSVAVGTLSPSGAAPREVPASARPAQSAAQQPRLDPRRAHLAGLDAGLDVAASPTGTASTRAAIAAAPVSRRLPLVARSPKRNTVNADAAFWGDLTFAVNYNGLRILNRADPEHPWIVADVDCRGPQNDVTVWKNLVFLSVDQPQTREGCNSQDVPIDVADPSTWTGFEGIRILDISNPRDPVFVKGVETDCGSHTNTLVPDLENNRVLLYVLSYSLRPGPRCGPGSAASDPLHRKISIVSVPLDRPQDARVVVTPRVRAPIFDLGAPLLPTVGCHDMQVLVPRKLAAVACLTDAQLWDISDPIHPKTLTAVHIDNPDVDIWHSAAFSWDGKVVVFGDETEEFPCGAPASRKGRLWFYSVAGHRLLGSFTIPRAQPGQYCSAHVFNVIPVRDRYLLVSAWYQGGTTVVDFTRPAAAREIAFFDARTPLASNAWASYWFNDRVYVNDIDRGVDILRLRDRATFSARRFPFMNPQTQMMLLR